MARLQSGTRIYGNAIIDTNLSINGSTVSSSYDTGALIVKGGLGVAGNVFINADLNAKDTYIVGNLTVTGNAAVGGIKTDNYYYANGSPVDFQQTAGSTGALQYNNNGDFGASANLTWNNSTSTLTVTGEVSTTTVTATTLAGSLTTAAQPNVTSVGTLTSVNVSGNANVGNINSSGVGYIAGNLDAGNVNTGGVLKSTNSTNSTGTGTGALIVSGGASISKDLYIGGNLYVPNIVSQSSVTLEVSDPLLYLNASPENPYDYDIGFYSDFSTGAGTGHQITGLFRNHADNAWYLVSNLAEPSGGVADLSNANTVFDNVKLGGNEPETSL